MKMDKALLAKLLPQVMDEMSSLSTAATGERLKMRMKPKAKAVVVIKGEPSPEDEEMESETGRSFEPVKSGEYGMGDEDCSPEELLARALKKMK